MVSLVERLQQRAEQFGTALTPEQAEELRNAAAQQRSMITTLLDIPGVDERGFLSAVASDFGMPWWSDTLATMPSELRQKFPVRLALRHHILPITQDETGIWLLTYDPFDALGQQLVGQALGAKARWAMAPRKVILQGLRQGYGVGAETFEQILEGRAGEELFDHLAEETNKIDEEDSEASVVNFVNQIIREAIAERATDIHVEPLEDDLRIRYRTDGVLREAPVPPQIKLLQASVISRLKIMAHLDIAERRLPQDGRINLEFEGKHIDVRVATIPSVTGESVSLRLLGQEKFTFERLGLDGDDDVRIRSLLALPNGIVLVTGPTGSGKSTTLYTLLSSLNVQERRIVTIEDPVEHKIPGVIQIAVKPEIDLTFARGLRSILRGDPNVVMIGEMRDLETAEIAIRAALTGHLVFSTLHTNDAISGIIRLVDMGIEPFLVANSVRAFIAQRLVRRLCVHCRTPAQYSAQYLRDIVFDLPEGTTIYKACGCEACRNTGYQSRMAIFEICLVSEQIQEMVVARKSANLLRHVALQEGMRTLRMDGFMKVIKGLTTIEEVMRVTAADLDALDE